jgi:hypothetical protein
VSLDLIFAAISSRLSATIVLMVSAAEAIFCEEPTARNSNLLPVKAKGDVRLRSVLSLLTCGREEMPRSMISSLVAYSFFPKKPAIQFEAVNSQQLTLF